MKNIWEVSDINRGNFLELLHFRCKEFPWLKDKLQSQLKAHAQWTSPSIQNEIIDIVSGMVLKIIMNDVRSSEHYSIIVDETPDISRSEQVSLCLRYVFEGQTLETFVGFFTTVSTEAEVLYELVKKQIPMLELKTENIVGECFYGAAIHEWRPQRSSDSYERMFTFSCLRPLLWSSFEPHTSGLNDVCRASS